MGDTLRISRAASMVIAAHAASSTDEVCGLLRGGDTVEAVEPCRNVHAAPTRQFEIDPAALIAAHRAAREGGPAIVGYYHSHPSGEATPSAIDAARAAPDGKIWLIIAEQRIAAFRAVVDGAIHGRFDPVTLLVAE